MTTSVTVERTFSQQDFDAFAALSGDDNPIHVDAQFAAETRFGRTVAHGMLLYTVLRGLIDKLVPGGRQVSQTLRFPAPTFADEPLAFGAEIVAEQDGQVTVALACERLADNTTTCDGHCVIARRAS